MGVGVVKRDNHPAGKILVTGANGFVGRRLCEHLLDENFEVAAAVRLDEKAVSLSRLDQLCLHKVGDICRDTYWGSALEGVDTVIHLAGRAHIMRERAADPLGEFRRINRDAALSLARQAVGNRVRRLIYLSTVKVHGELSSDRPFTEQDPPDPQDAYAVSKWEAEQGLTAIAREGGLELVIIRPPLIYGPGVKGNFRRLLEWLRRGMPLPLAGVNNRRSLVNLDNLVDLIALCISHPAAAGQTFLVSDDRDLSTLELTRALAQAMGRKARILPLPGRMLISLLTAVGKQGLAQRIFGSLQVNPSKIKELLGWRPRHSVEEGLARTVAWFLKARTDPVSFPQKGTSDK